MTKPNSAHYVAQKVMHAILVNQKNICIPKVLYLLAIVKSIIPSKGFMLLANFLLQPSRPNFEVNNLY
jgi:hypothetical protein